jgi:predicted DNA-binding transcriptional regulator
MNISDDEFFKICDTLKLVTSNQSRIKICLLLFNSRCTINDMCIKLSVCESNVKAHLHLLSVAGLVSSEIVKVGKGGCAVYSSTDKLNLIIKYIDLLSSKLEKMEC